VFTRLLNRIFCNELNDFVFDDIFIYSPSMETHRKHLEIALTKLRDNKLYTKRSKCTFGVAEKGHLGHLVGSGKRIPDPEKNISAEQLEERLPMYMKSDPSWASQDVSEVIYPIMA